MPAARWRSRIPSDSVVWEQTSAGVVVLPGVEKSIVSSNQVSVWIGL
jgi:hypothetical protein